MVQHERGADQGYPSDERTLEREPRAPALRSRRLEERPRTGRAKRLASGRPDERCGPPVEHALGGRHDDDDVGLDERGVNSQRNRARDAEVDEVVALDVVDLHVPVEATRELVGDEARQQFVAGAAREAARDEQRLVPALDSQPLELLDRGGDRLLSRVALGAGQRQRRRLDDDRRAAAGARHERLERLARERETQGVSDRGAHVRDSDRGRRRPERKCVVVRGHDDEPRPGEHGNARHQAISLCTRRNVRSNPRCGQKRDESRFVSRQSTTIVS